MFKKIAVWYRNYFGFSRTETRGSIGLMILLILVVGIYGFTRKNLFSTSYDEIQDSILLVQFHQYIMNSLAEEDSTRSPDKPLKPMEVFDPNTTSLQWLVDRGVDPRVASNWVNYLKKGGYFRDKSELMKIYGFSDSLFKHLNGYIRIPIKAKAAYPKRQKDLLIDINGADTTDLKRIRGIGSKLSTRIITFRDRLGGFTSLNQLYEVYYLDSSVVELAMKKFFISPDFIPRKIYINKISAENLARHPYVTNKEAKLVVSYREQHGDFSSIEDLLNIPILSTEKIKKIEPYIGIVDQ